MSDPKKIAIIDYGVGNLHSAVRAFRKFTDHVAVTDEAEVIAGSDALVLPGQGSFQSGIEGLAIRNLLEPVKNFISSGKPVLGICLGAQVLLSEGHEFGKFEGLGLIAGTVEIFPPLPDHEKIPHVGWNGIYAPKSVSWKKTIFENLPDRSDVYFVHSYTMRPKDPENILALANYGGHEFCAAVRSGNVFGTQFHPDVSGEVGLEIINNFLSLI